MPDRVTYEFAVIRVVPKVEREEFLNVGVIVFSKPKRYLGMQYLLDENRLKAFSNDLDLEELKAYLQAWERITQGGKEAGPIGQEELPYRFRWLTAPKSTLLQCSQPHPGLCTDPEKELNALFQLFVYPSPKSQKTPWYLIGFLGIGLGLGIGLALLSAYLKAWLTGGIEEETVGVYLVVSLLIVGPSSFLIGRQLERKFG